jgi:hypothetical protein
MVSFSVRMDSVSGTLSGWRYLWAKKVSAFDPKVHCARCLVGPYEKAIGTKMPVNVDIQLEGYNAGDILYICGVATPYVWRNNLHLPVRVTGDENDVASVPAFNGSIIVVTGAEAIPFSDAAANELYGERGKSYLTCRNFQFGAELAQQGLIARR